MKSKKYEYRVILIFIILFSIGLPTSLIFSVQEPSITVQNESVKITGLYGETIPIRDITNIELTNIIPVIKLRTNGLDAANVLKGYFLMEGIGTAKLFLSSSSGPYIKIQTSSNRYIFINFKKQDKIEAVYNQIKDSCFTND